MLLVYKDDRVTLRLKAGFPSNATHATKYVTNAVNARKVRNKRS